MHWTIQHHPMLEGLIKVGQYIQSFTAIREWNHYVFDMISLGKADIFKDGKRLFL